MFVEIARSTGVVFLICPNADLYFVPCHMKLAFQLLR